MKRNYWLAAGLLWLSGTAIADEAATPQTPPAKDAEVTEKKPLFNIFDFQIDGNTILDDESLERAVYPYLGPDKTVEDVEKARASLEEAYRKKGYPTVVVSIPEQNVDAEQVHLAVLEGSIESVRVTGSQYHALDTIRDGVPALAEGKVPDMPKVQEQLNTLSKQSPDRNVTPIFRAGSTPGKMEVELRVKDELPLHGSVEMNSRQSQHTTYSRLIGSIHYDNLWQKFHSASFQYQVSPQNSDEVQVWSGTYVMPTGWADTRLAMYGIGVSSNTQNPLGGAVNVGGLSVVGTGNIFGGRLVKPLPGSDTFLQSVTGGVDYKTFAQGQNLANQSLLPQSSISYLSFMTGYDGSWHRESSTTTLNLATHFAFRGLVNNAQEFSAKGGASPDFLYLTTDIKHQHILPKDFRIQAKANGQISSATQVPNEQFSAGGPLSVRGYYQTQLLGDNGINLSMELYTPRLVPLEWAEIQNLRLFTFFDWANVWTYQAIAPTPALAKLASTGMGMRLLTFKHVIGEVDWSYPLNKEGTVNVGSQRVDFRAVYEF